MWMKLYNPSPKTNIRNPDSCYVSLSVRKMFEVFVLLVKNKKS